MYVVIHHQIQDPKAFWGILEQVPAPPPGLRNIMFFPSMDNASAFCVYEADSVESLRRFIDDGLGASSRNSYYPINAEAALGLPA